MRRPAFIVPLLLLLVPVVVLTVFALVQYATVENGWALQQAGERQLFYLAQSGTRVAWYALAAGNFTLTTHLSDGTTPAPPAQRLVVNLPGVTYNNSNGWLVWQWQPGDPPPDAYTGTGRPESFQFQVYFPQPGRFKIVCQATVGNHQETCIQLGRASSAFQYDVYANGDLSDFSHYGSSSVTGPVQVNGDAWFCPMLPGSTLGVSSNLLQVAGDVYRFEDIWGNPDGGGTVTISQGGQSGPPALMDGAAQGFAGPGQAYDSFNPAWPLTNASGAISHFGGVVVDQNLGGQRCDAASPSLAPGGYFDTLAGLHVTSATSAPWLTSETLTNAATNTVVTAAEIDLQALWASGNWPSNGLLYASTPIALVHGEKLWTPLTVVSNSTIYVHGSYNRNFSNLIEQVLFLLGFSARQPAALMTSDRIFLLSDAWSDSASMQGQSQTAAVYPLFLGDLNALVVPIQEVNGALVDGQPAVDMLNYVVSWQGVPNLFYGPAGDPHTDGFLEDWSSVTALRYGCFLHLENATMATFDNANAGPGVTAWMVRHVYVDPHRDYLFDPGLATNPPPGNLQVGTRLMWQRTSP